MSALGEFFEGEGHRGVVAVHVGAEAAMRKVVIRKVLKRAVGCLVVAFLTAVTLVE